MISSQSKDDKSQQRTQQKKQPIMEKIEEAKYEESVDLVKKTTKSRQRSNFADTEPLLERQRDAVLAPRFVEVDAPKLGGRSKSLVLPATISAIIGFMFEYFQNAINLVFVVNVSGSAYGLIGGGLSLEALLLSQTINELFGRAIYRGLNCAIDGLTAHAQGSGQRNLCWLYYTQGKYINVLASIPIIVQVAV